MEAAENLGDATRTAYRSAFKLALAEGRARPLLIPFCLLAPFVVPALWLAVPHARRPWLYRARWLVVGFVAWSNVYHVAGGVSSTNMAFAYAAGLAATWGTMLTMNLLVWTRPQMDAARTLMKRRRRRTKNEANGSCLQQQPNGNQLRQRKAASKDSSPGQMDESEDEDEAEFEHVWQPYPADEPFLQRLGWALDLLLCFRCSGWNWSISSIPHPAIPRQIRPGDSVDMSSMPRVSRSGRKRHTRASAFIGDRLRKVVLMYLVLDFLAIAMMKDPYFILGPDNHRYQTYALPPHLRCLPPWLLLAYRELFSLAGVYAAIEALFGISDLVQYWLLSRFWPSRAGPWQFSSTFGSLAQVLDRGLAGWWGAWWHQTFRMQFLAPLTYLVREGHLQKGSSSSGGGWLAPTAGLLVSFLQSGLLHASGSATAIPRTKPWRQPAFFMLQAVGIAVQLGVSAAVKPYVPHPPRMVSRAANLLFTLTWLYLTAPLFIDDLAASGLWLLEPVPVSPLRLLGFGRPDDHWWRLDRDALPRWYVGRHWWEVGIQI